jgi:hypothetical protein
MGTTRADEHGAAALSPAKLDRFWLEFSVVIP